MDTKDELKLRIEKGRRAGSAIAVELQSGRTAQVNRFEMFRTYEGLLEGLPRTKPEQLIRSAHDYVCTHWNASATAVVPPDILDAESDTPILPPMTMMATLTCYQPRNQFEDGSTLTVVWFADVDEQKSIRDYVEAALRSVDWNKEAREFSI